MAGLVGGLLSHPHFLAVSVYTSVTYECLSCACMPWVGSRWEVWRIVTLGPVYCEQWADGSLASPSPQLCWSTLLPRAPCGITRDNTPSADFWPISLASLHSSLPRLPVWHKLFALQFSQYLLLSFQMPAYYFLALRTFNICELGLSKCMSKKAKQQNTVFILLLLERWCYIYNINFAYSSDTWIRKCMWKGFSRRFEGYLYGFQD